MIGGGFERDGAEGGGADHLGYLGDHGGEHGTEHAGDLRDLGRAAGV